MTIFSDNPYDRRMERLMMTVPNFAPRGVGVRFSESQVLITITAATPTEILAETMRQIRCPPFRKRFNEYIESEEKPMTYINEKHRARFTLAARNVHRENYALLSALYLLTADQRLWSCCKHHINNGCVFFENIKLNNCTERAYTFYCAAKALQEALAEIDAEQVRPLELYVTEVVFPEELDFLQDRFANLDEVNYLAKRMDSFFGDEEYQFYEAMKLEGFDTLPDLINLSFNLNRYPLIRDIGDMGKIGREYLLTVKGCLPADDADDPKYAEFGQELIRSGKGIFTEHGLLFVDEDTPFIRDYDGQNFPAYVYNQMLSVRRTPC